MFEDSNNKRRKLNHDIISIFENKGYNDLLIEMIKNIENDSNFYLNYDNIIDNFKEILLNNTEGIVNRCITCKVDMGRSNPRQLCRKTYCDSDI